MTEGGVSNPVKSLREVSERRQEGVEDDRLAARRHALHRGDGLCRAAISRPLDTGEVETKLDMVQIETNQG